MTKVFFHFPDFEAFVSGGNSYNVRFEKILLDNYQFTKVNNVADANLIISDTIFLTDNEALEFLNQSNLKKIIIVHHLKYFEDNTYFEEFTLLKKFDLLIANSQYTAGAMQKNGIEADKIVIIEPPTNHQVNLLNIKNFDSIKVLIAANWIDRKGFIELFNAIKEVGDDANDLTITIFGDNTLDDTYYQKCVQLVNESSILSNVIKIKGVLPPEKMLSTFQNYNLFVSASKMETYGMAVKEALDNGLFVLALNKGNIPNLINEPSKGKLFNTHQNLVEYLCYLSNDLLFFKKTIKEKFKMKDIEKNKFVAQINKFIKNFEQI